MIATFPPNLVPILLQRDVLPEAVPPVTPIKSGLPWTAGVWFASSDIISIFGVFLIKLNFKIEMLNPEVQQPTTAKELELIHRRIEEIRFKI